MCFQRYHSCSVFLGPICLAFTSCPEPEIKLVSRFTNILQFGTGFKKISELNIYNVQCFFLIMLKVMCL